MMVACMRLLELNDDIVNVNGGGIAMGHPIGCSGARILTTLLYEMRRRGVRYGVASLCVGGGQGVATVIENSFFVECGGLAFERCLNHRPVPLRIPAAAGRRRRCQRQKL